MSKIDTYKKILQLVDEGIDNDSIMLNRNTVIRVIEELTLAEEFGIKIPAPGNNYPGWIRLHEWMALGKYSEESNRQISWSDDGRQPNNEWLLQISFPSGPYCLHPDYPSATFDKMFEELKGFGPKYCDTHNHNLYFDASNAGIVFNAFNNILKKYRGMVAEELKQKRKEELQRELEAMG